MENLVTIKEVGAYSERQYQKQQTRHETSFYITDIQPL